MTMSQAPERFRLGDLSEELFRAIGTTIRDFTVPLIAQVRGGPPGRETLYGSATLVTICDQPFLLTATHVWEKLDSQPYIGIALTQHMSRFVINREYLSPTSLATRRSDEWGPDLTLVTLPSSHVGRMKAHKSFYNLSKRQAEMLGRSPDREGGFWGVSGFVAEESVLDKPELGLAGLLCLGGIDFLREAEGFDYLEVGVDRVTTPDLPNSFGGVSGGGLWHFNVIRPPGSADLFWDGRIQLEGVAFYETAVDSGRQLIRCHGRKSLYVWVSNMSVA